MADVIVECLDPRSIVPADEEAIHRLRQQVWPNASADGFLALEYGQSWKGFEGPQMYAPAMYVVRHGQEIIALVKTLARMIQIHAIAG